MSLLGRSLPGVKTRVELHGTLKFRGQSNVFLISDGEAYSGKVVNQCIKTFFQRPPRPILERIGGIDLYGLQELAADILRDLGKSDRGPGWEGGWEQGLV